MLLSAIFGPVGLGTVRAVILFLFAGVCAYTDWHRHLIYNWVTGAAGVAALVLAALAGWPGLVSTVLGALVAGGLFLIPVAKGWAGGGDLKFMAVVGALVGIRAVIPVILLCSVAGGVYAVGHLVWLAIRSQRDGIGDLMSRLAQTGMPMAVPYGLAVMGYAVAIAVGGIRVV